MTADRASNVREREPKALKTWGPFTGQQLTVMISVAIVMVLFPVGAWAVTGSNVFVTDATAGTHAKVDSTGHVLVGDGTGPLSVDGTVQGRPVPPSTPFYGSLDDNFGNGY